MKRPSLQWYPADWRNNANLRRCSWAARGAWIEVIGLLHDSDEYGVLRWTLREIAQAIGAPVALLRELADKNVLKGCDAGTCEPYVYTPRSGRRNGAPVVLISAQPGPIWYGSRLVRDEYVRNHAGAASRFTKQPDTNPAASGARAPSPSRRHGAGQGDSPSRRLGEGQGDGSTSTSTYSVHPSDERAGAGAPPGPADVIFATGVPLLTAAGVSDRNARSMLGLMRKQHGDEAVIDALARCAQTQPLEPVAWLQAALKPKPAAAARRRDDGRTAAAIAVFGHAPDQSEVVDVG